MLGKSSLLHVTCGAFTLVVMSREKQLSQVLMVYVNSQDKPQLMGRTDTDVHIALVPSPYAQPCRNTAPKWLKSTARRLVHSFNSISSPAKNSSRTELVKITATLTELQIWQLTLSWPTLTKPFGVMKRNLEFT